MQRGDFIEICKGRIYFDAIDKGIKQAWVVPLATFSMRMDIIDEDEDEYKHYFLDSGRLIEVDGATWMEAQEMLTKE